MDSVALFTVTFHILFTNLSSIAILSLNTAGWSRRVLNAQQRRRVALSHIRTRIVTAPRLGLLPWTILQLGTIRGAQITRLLWIFTPNGVVFGVTCEDRLRSLKARLARRITVEKRLGLLHPPNSIELIPEAHLPRRVIQVRPRQEGVGARIGRGGEVHPEHGARSGAGAAQGGEAGGGGAQGHVEPRRGGLHGGRAGAGHAPAQDGGRGAAQTGDGGGVAGAGGVDGGGRGGVAEAGGADGDRGGGPQDHRLGGWRGADGRRTYTAGQAVFNGVGTRLRIATAAWRTWRRDYHLTRLEAGRRCWWADSWRERTEIARFDGNRVFSLRRFELRDYRSKIQILQVVKANIKEVANLEQKFKMI
ncbi:hypothetical protein TcasGA2_TC012555 [Tribolium castaneum]|uniref:Uncharacterized protein n=1 Tax=Tribolium castaneum TaxID=7070 RepID=D6X370_TRICA|nr:hypothetical protein TcasGA2_TC012555 [Tribolium castaneum]